MFDTWPPCKRSIKKYAFLMLYSTQCRCASTTLFESPVSSRYGDDEELALAHYHALKASHLASLPRDVPWTIPAAQVEAFLSARQVEKPPLPQPLSPVA